jgi:hypothetical protein
MLRYRHPDRHMMSDPVIDALVQRVTALERQLSQLSASIVVPYSGARFSVYATGTTAVSGATLVALAGTAYADAGWNSSTSTYTAPVSGRYLFTGIVYIQPSGASGSWSALYVNGGFAALGAYIYSATGNVACPIATILSLNAGDAVTLRVSSLVSATVLSGATWTYLQGQIL